MLHTVGDGPIPMALEALAFAKPNKKYPTYNLIQKVWNKCKYVQQADGYTDYSPLWHNDTYTELAKLQIGGGWKSHGVTHIKHVFRHGRLRPLADLRVEYGLPSSMLFQYMQLQHAVRAQSRSSEWHLSPTPVFSLLGDAVSSKGFISECYAILLQYFLGQHPVMVREKWEKDVGQLDGEQWEEIFQGVSSCSLNVAQRLTQLYIIFRVYYTPRRLQLMGMQTDDVCTRCKRVHGDLIHLLWRCPKLHKYWSEVMSTVNSVFGVSMPVDPRVCLLGVLEEHVEEVYTREAVQRALFQARKLIMIHWKSETPPTLREWIDRMGE
ncbi:uncharacterized protein LOC120917483 [Rana temporaria]|uniref:uncharacterized protein LOC120917483 n=1 Tax=Rana temporaria TaxID=8407 RepID=UPI001AADC824|nr:uncharacterized protein LOC120917483 [Rana temporaria]